MYVYAPTHLAHALTRTSLYADSFINLDCNGTQGRRRPCKHEQYAQPLVLRDTWCVHYVCIAWPQIRVMATPLAPPEENLFLSSSASSQPASRLSRPTSRPPGRSASSCTRWSGEGWDGSEARGGRQRRRRGEER